LTGTLRRTLEALANQEATLPKLCNILGRITSPPILVRGEKWVFGLEGLSGTGAASVAVHLIKPTLDLPYSQTAPELLRLMEDETLRNLFSMGETVLVQAVPRRGLAGLWLNVESILIIRPHRVFGRTQIDFEDPCPRRSYLSVVKGVKGNRRNSLSWGSVKGNVVHDLFSHWATHPGTLEDPEPKDPFSHNTLLDLLHLGIVAPEAIQEILRAGDTLRRTVLASPTLRGILQQGPWEAESKALNNGVSVSPDLLSMGAVVELKHMAPGSPYSSREKQVAQLEAYLAWAMVEYGAQPVSQTWKALLVQLHPDIPDQDRVLSLPPRPNLVAPRILARHKLLALHGGHWLPRPGEECHYCDYGDIRDADEPGAPPPCEFYCQTERSWPCEKEGNACKLLGRCNQRRHWHAFDSLDRFNGYRKVLVEEEEEREFVVGLVESITEGSGAEWAGLGIGGFQVHSQEPGLLFLRAPDWTQEFELALRGDCFRMARAGAELGIIQFAKRKGQTLRFKVLHRIGAGPQRGEQISLWHIPRWESEPRDLLSFLDGSQRSPQGADPMRPATASPVTVVESPIINLRAPGPDLILVDVAGLGDLRREVEDALLQVRGIGSFRVLVAGAEGIGVDPPTGAACMDRSAIADDLSSMGVPLHTRLGSSAEKARLAQEWFLSRAELQSGRLLYNVSEKGRFALLVVAEAEKLPIVLLARCFELADRVVLIGQSQATGPVVEAPSARRSEMFQNTFAYLLAGALHVLPTRVSQVQVVKRQPSQAIKGAGVLHLAEGIRCTSTEFLEVPEDQTQNMTTLPPLTLQATFPSRESFVKRIALTLQPDESIRGSSLQALMRGISHSQIVDMKGNREGTEDRTLIGHRVRVDTVEKIQEPGTETFHSVKVSLPLSGFRYIQERIHHSRAEVDAAIRYVRDHSAENFILSSPFHAQCLLLASACAEAGLASSKVVPLDRLGRKALKPGGWSLLFSWGISHSESIYPAPLDDLGRLLELFYGDWSRVVILASAESMLHHPLLQALKGNTSIPGSPRTPFEATSR